MRKIKIFLISFMVAVVGVIPAYSSEVKHFEYPHDGALTQQMREFFDVNGFLLLDNYLTAQECGSLLDEGHKLIADFNPTPETTAVFSTDKSQAEIRGKYFEDSADKCSFFFEEKAFRDGHLQVSMEIAINKIGHALGECNDKFRAATFRKSIRLIAEQLGIEDPRLNQSMLICKPRTIGGEVRPHQDSTFLYTEPNTTLGFWIPLQDANPENACLKGIPGSHKWDLLTRHIRNPEGTGFMMVRHIDSKPLTDAQVNQLYSSQWSADAFVPLPMKAGSILIFPGTFVHASDANLSDKSRNAYTFHVISGKARYPSGNWLQRDKFAKL